MKETKTIQVKYFALLREERGLSEETLSTESATVQELFEQLRLKHRFRLGRERLNVVVNDEFTGWDEPLKSGDSVVFIPPVAGG
jgi:molybdopterin converting factor subunit 1